MKVHCLGIDGQVNKTLTFAEGKEGFSTTQSIYEDDSIYTIKHKIATLLDNCAPEEIYLFMRVEQKINWFQVYNECKPSLTYDKLIEILSNLDIPFENIPQKDEYFYDEFLKMIETNTSIVKIPLGQKFSKYHDYTFCVNPFERLTTMKYQPNPKNHLVSFDNMLLLNWGKPLNNEIFACFAEESAIPYKQPSRQHPPCLT
jgi:hypothetical protein